MDEIEMEFAIAILNLMAGLEEERRILMNAIPWYSRAYLRDLRDQEDFR